MEEPTSKDLKGYLKDIGKRLSSKSLSRPDAQEGPVSSAEDSGPRFDDLPPMSGSLRAKLTLRRSLWVGKSNAANSSAYQAAKNSRIRNSHSEINFNDIMEDLPSNPYAEPPALAPRGIIRSVSHGGEDHSSNLAAQAAEGGWETNLDAILTESEPEVGKKPRKSKKRAEKPAAEDDEKAPAGEELSPKEEKQPREKERKPKEAGEKPKPVEDSVAIPVVIVSHPDEAAPVAEIKREKSRKKKGENGTLPRKKEGNGTLPRKKEETTEVR